MIYKNCNYPGCGKLIKKGKSYCEKHSKLHDGKYKSNKWQKIRRIKINNNPLCEVCESKNIIKKAEIVHHIKDAFLFPEFFYNIDNLQSVCRSCHKNIHDNQNKNNKIGFNINIGGEIIRIKNNK